MELPSKYIENAVEQFAGLPGIGKRTALRLALHILNQSESDVLQFSESFLEMKRRVKHCSECHNVSDQDTCAICSSPKRDRSTICVVEDMRDVIAIENTNQYFGLYHILGGIISPMDGIGPADLNVITLLKKASSEEIREVVFALPTTMEGDTTGFYLYKKLKDTNVKLSAIAKGIAIGDNLEFTDEITLGRSILNRMPYESNLVKY